MAAKAKVRRITRLQDQFIKEYGSAAAKLAADGHQLDVIPTGILALDYALGTGGWPRGYISHVYAPADIGKSNSIGLQAIRNAQKMGLVPAVVAYEPGFNDPEWIAKHGVDPEQLLVLFPENGEEAVEMTLKLIGSGDCDLVIFDSIGAMLNTSETEADGKVKAGGQSPIVSRLVKSAAPKVYRYNVALILLNQIRANFNSPVPGSVQYPGGYTLEHLSSIHVRMRYGKNGKKGYTVKENGEDVTIGRQIVAIVERNKLNEGSNQKAPYDFYIKDTNGEFPLGVDTVNDVVSTGKRLGIISQSGPYYQYGEHKVQGLKKVEQLLKDNPEMYDEIRAKVLEQL